MSQQQQQQQEEEEEECTAQLLASNNIIPENNNNNHTNNILNYENDIENLQSDLVTDILSHSTDSLLIKDITQLFHKKNTSSNNITKRLPSDTEIPSTLQQIELSLKKIYNKIQVLLLRNHCSLDFLKIFQIYISILLDENILFYKDKYYHFIKEYVGYEINKEMNLLMNKFLLEPTNIYMKLANFMFNGKLRIKNKVFHRWLLKTDIIAQLIRLERIWYSNMKLKVLNIWIKKANYENTLNEEADDFRKFILSSKALDNWLDRTELYSKALSFSDSFFLNKHVFNRMSVKKQKIEIMNKNADSFRHIKLMERVFKQWKLNGNLLVKFNAIIQNKYRKFVFKLIKNKYFNDKKNLLISKNHNNGQILQNAFQNWKLRFEELRSNESQLTKISGSYIMEKYMGVWIKSYNVQLKISQVRYQYNIFLKKNYFLNVWLKKSNDCKKLENLIFEKSQEKCLKIMENWVLKVDDYARADTIYFAKLKEIFFKKWRLVSISNFFEATVLRPNLLNKMLQRWKDELILESQLALKENVLLDEYFATWHDKLAFYQDSYVKADKFLSKKLRWKYFSIFKKKYDLIQDNYEKSNFFIMLRSINVLKNSIRHIKEVNEQERLFIENRPISNSISRKYFKLWKQKENDIRDLKYMVLLNEYLETVQNFKKQEIFQLWISKMLKQVELRKNADVLANNFQKKRVFSIIKQQQLNSEEYKLLADESRRYFLLMNFFIAWKNTYANTLSLLGYLGILNEKKQLTLQRAYLNVWTVKYLKVASTNETADAFIKRWDRATLRATLMIWREKTKEKKIIRTPISDTGGQGKKEEGEENDLTYDTSLIPREYFETPTKPRSRTTSSIPMSERIKQTRMSAMKNRYKKASLRAIPSPIKSSSVLNSTIKNKFSPIKNRSPTRLQKSDTFLNINSVRLRPEDGEH
ncbi:uncharacterized protein SCODWIG_03098 [Saccharomycodes ludwigii]|uniref:Sfi1 spindle body domain-containing protein n=1 Tax=Saccharomycodes ludwigii TaxID=36035 RepID=A0A376B9K1_9ASCO|nr:uncharacterized protein SCODWIG_03098 [Saccharomycodes ludwigii]